jgi:hypothetical protein
MSELTKALVKFQQEVGKIHKDAKAQYGAYADLSGVLSTINPILNKHGLCLIHTFDDDILIAHLRHVSGEELISKMKLVHPPSRNDAHARGGAITYFRRYTACAIAGIVADMDTDGIVIEDPEPAKPVAKKKVQKKAPAKTVDAAAEELAKSTNGEVIDAPISQDEYNMVLGLLKEVHKKDPNKLATITEQFRKYFPDTADSPLSQSITTQAHVNLLNELI